MRDDLRLKLKPKVSAILDHDPRTVFTYTQVIEMLEALKAEDETISSLSFNSFIKFLINEPILSDIRLNFPHRSLLRFLKQNFYILELTHSLAPHGYLSHRSAIDMHELSDIDSLNFYVNEEQTPKPQNNSKMQQQNIDRTFKKGARLSNNFVAIGDQTLYVLNGKNTKNAGTMDFKLPSDATVRVTTIERTLIDIVVRPFYAGGVNEVLTAYQRASSKVDPEIMANLLASLRHTYPYHQSIGFFMERSGGWGKSAIEIFLQMPREYDFYLDHKIENPTYSKEWRVYYPKALDEK